MPVCFLCEMKKYPLEVLLNPELLMERKEEFYPEEEFGDMAAVCEECDKELLKYFLSK